MTSPVELLQPDAADATSNSEQAYYAIRELIVTLELQPGSLVSEADLMTRLGLGRTPIREALRALARENLIEVYSRRGMFVASIDMRDLAAVSEVRSVLEPYAARLAATRRTDDDLSQLRDLLDELASLGRAVDERQLIEIDQRIHRFVHRAAHNTYLESILDEHYMHALRIWFVALDRVTNLEAAVLEHRTLLEAILSSDADRAGAVMSTHVDEFEGSIRRSL